MVRCCLGGATGVLPSRTSRMVSNYELAPDLNQVDILRVVVKENFSEAHLDCLVADIVCIDARATVAHVHRVDRDHRRPHQPRHFHLCPHYSRKTPREALFSLLPRKSAPLNWVEEQELKDRQKDSGIYAKTR